MFYRTVILAAAISTGVAIKAQAQDYWQGFYGGVSITGPQRTSKVGTNAAHRYKIGKEASLGLYGGYNFTGAGNFVWGPEIGLIGFNNKASRTDAALGVSNLTGSLLLSTRVRGGWASEKVFFYGAVGAAFSDTGVNPAGINRKEINTGLGYGVGVEMAVGNGWSARLDAMNYEFGKAKAQSFNGSSQEVGTQVRTISIGLSRKF